MSFLARRRGGTRGAEHSPGEFTNVTAGYLQTGCGFGPKQQDGSLISLAETGSAASTIKKPVKAYFSSFASGEVSR